MHIHDDSRGIYEFVQHFLCTLERDYPETQELPKLQQQQQLKHALLLMDLSINCTLKCYFTKTLERNLNAIHILWLRRTRTILHSIHCKSVFCVLVSFSHSHNTFHSHTDIHFEKKNSKHSWTDKLKYKMNINSFLTIESVFSSVNVCIIWIIHTFLHLLRVVVGWKVEKSVKEGFFFLILYFIYLCPFFVSRCQVKILFVLKSHKIWKPFQKEGPFTQLHVSWLFITGHVNKKRSFLRFFA